MTREILLGLLNPVIAFIFALTFFVVWARQKERSHVLMLAGAYALLGIGFIITHATTRSVDVVVTSIVSAAHCLGTILLISGICRRAEKHVPLFTLAGLSVITLAANALLTLNFETQNYKLLALNAGYGAMFLIGGLTIRESAKKKGVDSLLFWMLMLTSMQFFVRPALTLGLDGELLPATYFNSSYVVVLNMTVALLSVALALTLLATCVSDLIEDIQRDSSTDFLTGLSNRAAFEEQASQILKKVERTPLPVTMVLADIDHFKQINDRFGHQAGDLALGAFGRLFGKSVRGTDLTGRIGGEEFCAILWNADLEGGKLTAETIRNALLGEQLEGLPIGKRLTASFGVAQAFPDETLASLFARADAALYIAKNNGRDRVECDKGATNEMSFAGRNIVNSGLTTQAG